MLVQSGTYIGTLIPRLSEKATFVIKKTAQSKQSNIGRILS
jgi:hypothetical protein